MSGLNLIFHDSKFSRSKYHFALVQYCKWYVEQFRSKSGFMIQLKPASVRLSLHSFHILSYLRILPSYLIFLFVSFLTRNCQNMMSQKYQTYKFIGVLRLLDIFANKFVSIFLRWNRPEGWAIECIVRGHPSVKCIGMQ